MTTKNSAGHINSFSLWEENESALLGEMICIDYCSEQTRAKEEARCVVVDVTEKSKRK